MTIPFLDKFSDKLFPQADRKQRNIYMLIAAYTAITVLHMCIMFIFGWYNKTNVRFAYLGYVAACIILIPLFSVPLVRRGWVARHPELRRFLLFLFNTFMVYFYTETITRYLAPNRIFCWQFVFGILLSLAVYYLFSAIFGSFRIAISVSNFVFAAMCISNRVLLDLRGRPLFISDFTSLKTALNVSSSYSVSVIKFVVIFLIFVLLTLYTILLAEQTETPVRKAPIASRIMGAVAVIILLLMSYCTDIYKNLNIKLTYWSHQNGIILDWVIESKDFRVKIPENYSAKDIEKIKKDYPAVTPTVETTVKPNIICVMNESFSDLSVVAPFNTDIDYMPFLHSAMNGAYDDMIVGNLYTSVYGGNTANSEYEFLTNDSMVLYPQNSVPYQTLLDGKGEISGVASQLKSLGYYTVAMHPYWASGWNRTNIYSYMGFDNQIYLDNMTNIDYIRGYCSDSCNYDKIIDIFEKRDKNVPFFLFNVTMQNHGGYTEETYPATVHLTDYPGEFPQAEQYLSLIRESDKALLELIEYFRKVEEPTVIIFFGDHQPSIETDFYEKLYNKSFTSLTDEESEKMYITKYMVWKNFETPYFELGDTSLNYLSALTLKMVGMPTTSYQEYLLDMRETYSIITAAGVRDKDGKYIPATEADLSFYKTIVYNHMLDNEDYKKEFFENTYEINNDYLKEDYTTAE